LDTLSYIFNLQIIYTTLKCLPSTMQVPTVFIIQ